MKSLMLLNPKKRKGKKGRKRSAKKSYKKVYKARRSRAIRRILRKYTKRRVKVRVRLSRNKRKAVIRVRVNPRRRLSLARRNPIIPSMGGIKSAITGLFSKENLTVASGAIAATVITRYALNWRKADNTPVLPSPTDPNMRKAANVAYALGIPLVGALVTRKFSPGAAKGMMLGGLINGIVEAIKAFAPPETAAAITGTNEYLDQTPLSAVGALPPSYMAASRFSHVAPMNGALDNGAGAFPGDAWSN